MTTHTIGKHDVPPSDYNRAEHIGQEDLIDEEWRLAGRAGRTSSSAELEKRDAFLVAFEDNDPDDPRNFSKPKKVFITLFSSLLCFTVTIGSSMPTGDLSGAAEALGVSEEVINLTVTLFVVGFGVGPMLFAPLSEAVGRWPVYLSTGFLYFIFEIPCALAQNIGTLLAARAIAGIAASVPMTNMGGTLSDIWKPEEKGIPLAVFSSVIFIGPALGPLIGGYIAVGTSDGKGWRYIYWTLFALTGIVFILTAFTSETLASVVLTRQAKQLRKKTGDSRYHSRAELERPGMSKLLVDSLLRPFRLLFGEPILICFSLYLCLVYSLLYLLFFALPIIFAEGHGFNAGEVGLTFLALVIGIVFAILYTYFVQERYYTRKRSERGYNTPEDRLPLMFVGSAMLPVGLFILAWTSMPHVHWAGPIVACIPIGAAFVMIYISANSYIVDCYPSVAASSLAAKTLARSLCGAAVPLFVNQMYAALSNQWAGSLMAFAALGVSPIPFLFYRYGSQFRQRSKRALNDADIPK